MKQLTEEMLDEIAMLVESNHYTTHADLTYNPTETLTLIRELLIRAKAIVHEAENQGYFSDDYDSVQQRKVIDVRIIDALREVLP